MINQKEFIELFYKLAREIGMEETIYGNLKCKHGKNICRKKLARIYTAKKLFGFNATSKELQKAGIQPCCFVIFRQISKSIFNLEQLKI